MRVLCLTRAAIRGTLECGRPLVKRPGDAAQSPGGTQGTDCRLGAHQLVRGAVEDDPDHPERPSARAGGEPHRLHVDRDRTASVQLRTTLAGDDVRDADDAAAAQLQAPPGEPGDEVARKVAADALLGVAFIRRRIHLGGDDHFAGDRLPVEPAAEAHDEQRLAGLTLELAGGRLGPRRPHPGLSHRGSPPCGGDQDRLEPQGSGHHHLARGHRCTPRGSSEDRTRGGSMPTRRRAATAAAWPLSTAPSSVAGQPVAVQVPASTSPATAVSGPGRSAPTPGRERKVAACSRVTRKLSTVASRARGSRAVSAGRKRSRSSSTLIPISRSAPDSDTARYWQPAGAPAARLRSKRYCTGVPTPAANACSQTVRS